MINLVINCIFILCFTGCYNLPQDNVIEIKNEVEFKNLVNTNRIVIISFLSLSPSSRNFELLFKDISSNYSRDIIFCKVYIDKPEVTIHYNVPLTPLTVIFTNGIEFIRIAGIHEIKYYTGYIKQLLTE